MSPRAGGDRRPRRHPWLLAATAAITALVIVVATGVVWFVGARAAAAADGTYDALTAPGDTGRWHAVTGDEVDATLAAGRAGGLTVSGDGEGNEDATSWLVQVTVDAASPAELRLWGEGARPAHASVLAPAGRSATTTLVRTTDAGALRVESTADATVTLVPIALFTPATPEAPLAPGGSTAIAPRAILDSLDGTGGPVTTGAEVAVSPAGLGEVPVDGVQAVWLQVSASGAGSVGLAGAAPASAPSALLLAPLDEDGEIRLTVTGSPDRVHASVVGWVADQRRTVDAATIEGGVLPISAVDVTGGSGGPDLPAAFADASGVALYAVDTDAAGTGSVGSADPTDGLSTRAPVSGRASALVAVAIGADVVAAGGAEVRGLTLVGILPTASADDAVEIEITSPAAEDSVDLAEGGGMFRIAGVVRGALDVRSVQVLLGDRYLGAAAVRAGPDGREWSLTTSAPGGSHEIAARAVSASGVTARDAVRFTVVEPARDAAVGAADVVVLDDRDTARIRTLAPAAITFDGAPAVHVGEILAAPAGPDAPEGMLRRVTAVERVGATTVVSTTPATLTEAVLQADVRGEGLGLVDPSQRAATAAPAASASEVTSGLVVHTAAATTVPAPSAADATSSAPTAAGLSSTLARPHVTGEFTFEYATSPGGKTRTDHSVTADLKLDLDGDDANGSTIDLEGEDVRGDGGDTAFGLGGTVAFDIRMTAVAALTIDIDIDWAWGLPRPVLTEFASTLTITRTQVTEIQTFGKIEISRSGTIGKDPKGTLVRSDAARKAVIFLGRLVGVFPTPIPIPWTLSFHLEPQFDIAFSIEGRFADRITETTVDTVGFRWADGRMQPVSDGSRLRTPSEPSVLVSLGLELSARLLIVAKAYEVVGFYIGPELTLEMVATAQATDELRLSSKGTLSLSAVLGAKLEVLDLTLAEQSLTIGLWEWELWDVSDVPLAGEDIALAPDEDAGTSTGTGERGLVVVLDLSGSMEGEKLVSAQDSLRRVVDRQAAGAELGVWTYPSDGSCGAGSFAIPVQPIVGTGELMQRIGELGADGQTPTGEALQSVADALRSEGRSGATILLISDGESNCATPPCDVARQLVAEGFDLDVETVGFQTSTEGAEELNCIAAATGGSYTEVTEPDALVPLLEELGRVQLTLEVALGPVAAAGAAHAVEVTVTNASGRDATDVRLTLTPVAGDLVPRVDPSPALALGNIPAGASVVRTLTLSPPGDTAVGDTVLRVGVWSAQSDLVTTEAGYRTAPAASLEPGPLLESAGTEVLVAPETDPFAEARPDAVRVAGDAGLGAEAPVRVLVPADPALIGIPAFLHRCAATACTLDGPEAQVMFTAAQRVDLSESYAALWREANTPERVAARGGTTAPVLVSAFPDVFGDGADLSCAGVGDESLASLGHLLIGMLNAAVQRSAEAAAATGAEVHFVRDTATALLPDRTVCDAASGVSLDAASGEIRFDAAAVEVIGSALTQWSAGRAPAELSAADLRTARAHGGERSWLDQATAAVFSPPLRVELRPGTEARGTIKPGQSLTLAGSGFAPGSPVAILTDTDGTLAASVFADEDGRFEAAVVVPDMQPAGTFVLTATGASAEGALQLAGVRLGVAAPVPGWIGLLCLAALVLLTAAAVSALFTRRRAARHAPSRPDATPSHHVTP